MVVLLVGSVAASFGDRLGEPTLLLFLGLGILLGEDGPGGIRFDDAMLARDAGMVALMVILAACSPSARARSCATPSSPARRSSSRSADRLRDLQDALDHVKAVPDAPHSGVHAHHSGWRPG